VLVTDYSSTMFDFAVTGKPIVLFAYDLDRYRDELRGFYFDIVPCAPGPVVRTSEALIEALAALPSAAEEHAGAYAAFRERFCALEDGRATERVVERVLAALAARR
jgi:CDP-glycerol glycerophosphotransferase